jgi:hypothetical protein
MYEAGLSRDLRDSRYSVRADEQKTLDKILRFGRSMTPASQKGIKGWPIRFAEVGKRFSGCFRWIRSSARNEGPVRRLKPSSSFLQCSAYRFHKPGFAAVTRLRR